MSASACQGIPAGLEPIEVHRGPSQLAVYEYPCVGKLLQPEPLVLIHGWGSDSRIWQAVLPELTQHLNVMAIDLPGFGQSPEFSENTKNSLEGYLSVILTVLPKCFSLMGWSLGGMLATLLASRYPERCSSLITLASNACFVQRANWPSAMPQKTFDDFYGLFQQQPTLCLKRFHGLQCRGDSNERHLLKALRETIAVEQGCVEQESVEQGDDRHACWQKGLELLAEIDNRQAISSLKIRGLHLYGDTDQLVPVAAANIVDELNPLQQVKILEQTAHLPQLSCPEKLMSHVLGFLKEGRYHLDKQRVADSFSRAANSYDSVARLQRQVGQQLLALLPNGHQTGQVIDLGCGTGYFTEQLAKKYTVAEMTGIDFAQGMLAFASIEHGAAGSWLCGDAENLPLADNSIDLIFSNLAFQWSEQLPLLAKEIARVLKPGGRLAFTSLGSETLCELKTSWAQVDDYVHVNHFLDAGDWREAFSHAGLNFQYFETDRCEFGYRDLRHLMDELKGLGAHNVNTGQQKGLTGRKKIRTLIQAYEQFRNTSGQLPATWDIIYGVATLNV
jgi:malonyl-CoA O-methyltransferase